MRCHDSQMPPRHSVELELVCQIGPDRGRIGREVGGCSCSYKVYFAGIKPWLIAFERQIGTVAEMLQCWRRRRLDCGLIRRAYAEPLQSAGGPTPRLPGP